MLLIRNIASDSLASEAGLHPGDKIISLNGETVNDQLDLEILQSSDILEFEIQRGAECIEVNIRREYGRHLGIEPDTMKIRTCRNNCVFCFVRQMPKGMRKSMYIKDEDYRYSFLDGNFTSLSNMKSEDWDRVARCGISPLYISVHAADPALRQKLTGNSRAEPIMERLAWLKSRDISFHTQLVIVPGWNDGENMEYSIARLSELYPAVLSISVVPVGLTSHRHGLPELKRFERQDAAGALKIISRIQRELKKRHGKNFLYASDEIYLLAEAEIPPGKFYGTYEQYENGVGMVRSFLDQLELEMGALPKSPDHWKVSVVTGALAENLLRGVLKRLEREKGLQSELIVCQNAVFGKSVTVTGLLCGKDIARSLEICKGSGPVLIPPNALNSCGEFLDSMSASELSALLNRQVIAPERFINYFP